MVNGAAHSGSRLACQVSGQEHLFDGRSRRQLMLHSIDCTSASQHHVPNQQLAEVLWLSSHSGLANNRCRH